MCEYGCEYLREAWSTPDLPVAELQKKLRAFEHVQRTYFNAAPGTLRTQRLKTLVEPLTYMKRTVPIGRQHIFIKPLGWAKSVPSFVAKLLQPLLMFSPLEKLLHRAGLLVPAWLKAVTRLPHDNTIYKTKSVSTPDDVLTFYHNLPECRFQEVDIEYEREARCYRHMAPLTLLLVLLLCFEAFLCWHSMAYRTLWMVTAANTIWRAKSWTMFLSTR
eukprot:TRINITY_DN19510_c0_g4_i1.p1 TRINITY_DN19510_c0_g4~~TRINITY_DN19510_c0_g4_i1.p1  ORF type:complete len:217 (-),score=11.98 TRINITY_DN19510_c0_g4_i1:182-832(-)